MTNKEFIESIAGTVRSDMATSGILASVTIAQACLESAYGTSELAVNANNLFGMKASLSGNTWESDWNGSTYSKETKEQDENGNEYTVTADFRRYASWAVSIKDHSDYLTGAKNGSTLRYAGLSGCKDYRTAAQLIKNGGYATDIAYVDKVCKVIEDYNLTQYDYVQTESRLKICLDAGHYGKYNQSPANKNYYESDMVWKLHLMLKKYLEEYGIEVITTRSDQATDRALYNRGTASKGCDLFISLHSNATKGLNDSTDYPASFCAINGKADRIGLVLAQVIENTIPTKQAAKIEHRIGDSGDDYYGVLRGATAVGTPGLILEHSFHTNTAITNWLLDDGNLDKLAKAEAQAIVEFYGVNGIEIENKSGWYQENGGWRFYLGDTGDYVKNDWYKDGVNWYWFDGAGMMIHDTWYQYEGEWYYFTSNGAMAKNGWLISDKELYRMTEDGSMYEGRVILDSDEKGALQVFDSGSNDFGYIKDGLFFCLDGVHNTRNGHDKNVTTYWHDISGNNNDPALSGVGGVTFGDTYCELQGAYFSIPKPAFGWMPMTFQIVCQSDETIERLGIVAGYSSTPSFHIGVTSDNMYGVNLNGVSTLVSTSVEKTRKAAFSITAGSTYMDTYNNQKMDSRAYINGGLISERINSGHTYTSTIYLGKGFPSGSTIPWKGKIYSVRIYNRELGQEELDYNYMIDKIRFNIQ